LNEEVARRVLRLVGLGVRSRGTVVGVEQVREAAKKGKVMLAVVAVDASQHSLAKVVPLLEARGVDVVQTPTASELGDAVGREHTAAVGIVNRELARGIRELLESAPARSQKEEV
jgi:ribosomal protein L7Ae-like RNA K-turn-binding protein